METPKWEYKHIKNEGDDWGLTKDLDMLGRKGWEIISVSPVHKNGTTCWIVYTLKRGIAQKRTTKIKAAKRAWSISFILDKLRRPFRRKLDES